MSKDRYRICSACNERYDDDALARCPKDGQRLLLIVGAADPYVGRTLEGRFTLTELLGKGGFGAVYRAMQHPVEREVAVKLLHTQHASDVDQVKRFFAEAKSVSRLRNQHTVALYDFGQAGDGSLFMAMELAPGESLAKLIRRNGPLTAPRAARIAAEVCESLAEAHELGIIHRDLKPDNIMVEPRRENPDFVKVLDFGIAKLVDQKEPSLVTATGVVQGTPTYMSPEQGQSQPLTPASDLYSLGIILYQMLTGRVPFHGETPIATIISHINDPPPDIRFAAPDVPEEMSALVMRLLSKRPGQRIDTADALRALLLELAGPMPRTTGPQRTMSSPPGRPAISETVHMPTPIATGAAPSGAHEPQKRRTGLYVAGAVAVVVVGLGVAWAMRTPAPEPTPTAAPAKRAPKPAARVVAVEPEDPVEEPPPPPRPTPPREVRPGHEQAAPRADRRAAATWDEAAESYVRLTVTATPSGSSVTLDGRPLGTAPIDARYVERTRRELVVEVTHVGYKPGKETVVLDRDKTLAFQLRPVAVAHRPPPVSVPGLMKPGEK